MALQVGDPAPDFTLPGAPGSDPVTLSGFRGEKNVVLLFFPLAFTGVCTTEMCSVQESYAAYEALDAQVLGVSVDSPFAQAAWAREQGIEFPLLSDFNKRASAAYGALYENFLGFEGVAKRAAFVIDKAGVLLYAEVLESAGELPDFAALQASLS